MKIIFAEVMMVAFLTTMIITKRIIPVLKRVKYGQYIREEGPKSHMSKAGTPTMGGVVFIITVVIMHVIYKELIENLSAYIVIVVLFGLLGLLDDYIKVVLKRNLGLRVYQKLAGQIIIAGLLVYYQYSFGLMGREVYLPFLSKYIDFGWYYYPVAVFVIVGSVNSINLTDGLDGLASGVTVIVLFFYSLIIASLYEINPIMNQVNIFVYIAIGICLGFIVFNKYPAKIFMGDVGSFFLGGIVSVIAISTGTFLFLPLLGGIYFIESLSVLVQVLSYKIRKKRVFKMSPVHHHFEEIGWNEKKIVRNFYLWSIIMGVLSIIII